MRLPQKTAQAVGGISIARRDALAEASFAAETADRASLENLRGVQPGEPSGAGRIYRIGVRMTVFKSIHT